MFDCLTQHSNVLFALLLTLLLLATGCAAHYTVHPGALSKADSAAYDALLVAETAIDEARQREAVGRLPPGSKDPLAALIRSYNVARESWLTYRGALATNVPAQTYFDQLKKNLNDLTTAIHNLEEVNHE